jgi:hypothetical protein
MAEVLEPPGAAPVKTWKVCRSGSFPHHASSGFGQKLKIYIPTVEYASRT